jgi:hypothetical protein
MIALAVMLSFVAFFWLGKVVGRAEGAVAVFEHIAKMRAGLSVEDKLLLDKWLKEYKERNET